MGSVARGSATLAFVGLVLATAMAANATPVTYGWTGGLVTLRATLGGSLLAGPITVALSGTSSITVDESALMVDSISFSIGSTPAIPLSTPINGYNSVVVDNATLASTSGTLTSQTNPPPVVKYSYSISPVSITGNFDATGTSPAITNKPFSFSSGPLTGPLFIDPTASPTPTLTLMGITIGAIQPAGAPAPILIKADITFAGQSPVPEPSTALMVGFGVLGLGASFSRRRFARR